MSTFVMRCCRAYRRIARFPHQYRAICGDGLEQLGEDLVPRVWQQQGVGIFPRFSRHVKFYAALRS
jgi:hypothetical protein